MSAVLYAVVPHADVARMMDSGWKEGGNSNQFTRTLCLRYNSASDAHKNERKLPYVCHIEAER